MTGRSRFVKRAGRRPFNRRSHKGGTARPIERVRELTQKVYSWDMPEITYPDRVDAWWEELFSRLDTLYEAYMVAPSHRKESNEQLKKGMLAPSNYALYEDALDTLKACQKLGFSQYVLSNNYPELEPIVKALGLSPYLSGVMVSAKIGYEKPRIELFQKALRLAGNPILSFMVGDNPDADVAGGRAAGMKTIFVHKKERTNADFHCENLSEIPAILLREG